MNTFARTGAAALAAALVFTLAACGGTTTTAFSTTSTPSTTSAGAATGTMMSEPMMSGSGSAMMSTLSAGASNEHNAADLTFAQMMIVHHQGAIEMADLATDRAANTQVKDLATRIKAAQDPEIQQMQTWLTAWGAAMTGSTAASTTAASTADDGMGGMDHGGMSGMGKEGDMSSSAGGMSMPGMMSDGQMQQLTDASGVEFDRLFLEMMIMHHQGAIEMANTEIAEGSNAEALALAESIKTSQTTEITEMQQLLQSL
jgi:uncharacterized protein (DUF305 family)